MQKVDDWWWRATQVEVYKHKQWVGMLGWEYGYSVSRTNMGWEVIDTHGNSGYVRDRYILRQFWKHSMICWYCLIKMHIVFFFLSFIIFPPRIPCKWVYIWWPNEWSVMIHNVSFQSTLVTVIKDGFQRILSLNLNPWDWKTCKQNCKMITVTFVDTL